MKRLLLAVFFCGFFVCLGYNEVLIQKVLLYNNIKVPPPATARILSRGKNT